MRNVLSFCRSARSAGRARPCACVWTPLATDVRMRSQNRAEQNKKLHNVNALRNKTADYVRNIRISIRTYVPSSLRLFCTLFAFAFRLSVRPLRQRERASRAISVAEFSTTLTNASGSVAVTGEHVPPLVFFSPRFSFSPRASAPRATHISISAK